MMCPVRSPYPSMISAMAAAADQKAMQRALARDAQTAQEPTATFAEYTEPTTRIDWHVGLNVVPFPRIKVSPRPDIAAMDWAEFKQWWAQTNGPIGDEE